MKKAAALLIVVLFIAIFGAVTVTATRAGLLNGIFTNNTIDAIIAEEASQSGLEAGLLDYKINGAATTFCVDVETGVTDSNPCPKDAKSRYADVTIALVPGNTSLIYITSIGHYGYVVRSHSLTQAATAWGSNPTNNTTILQPNGYIKQGLYFKPTACDGIQGPYIDGWKCVDEEGIANDNDFLYWYVGGGDNDYAIFSVPPHGIPVDKKINSVTVHFRSMVLCDDTGVSAYLRVNGRDYQGLPWEYPIQNFKTLSHTWTKNPSTNLDWSVSDLDNTFPGIFHSSFSCKPRTSQVYMTIDWSP